MTHAATEYSSSRQQVSVPPSVLDGGIMDVRAHTAAVRTMLPKQAGIGLDVVAQSMLGLMAHDQGRLSDAEALFRGVLEKESAGFYHALALSHLGLLLQQQERFHEARRSYNEAVTAFRSIEAPEHEALTLAYLSGLEMAEDRLSEADRAIAQADRLVKTLESSDRWVFETVVEIFKAALELAHARLAQRQNEEARAGSLVSAAQDRIDRWVTSDKAVSPYVRLSVRMLMGALGVSDPTADPTGEERLVIGPRARWFMTPEGERVDLSRRSRERRLLFALARRRQQVPNTSLSVTELFEEGWPGEEASKEHAAGRVYTAMLRLRKLGLRTLLLRRDDGYLIDPKTPIVVLGG